MTDPNPLREDEVEAVAACLHGAVDDRAWSDSRIDMLSREEWRYLARAAILRLDQVREGRGK